MSRWWSTTGSWRSSNYRELHKLSDEQRRRLRRKQRLYLEELVHVVAELRPERDEADVRAVVHGAIGAIQSILDYRETGLPAERVAARLAAMGHAVPGIAPSDGLLRDYER